MPKRSNVGKLCRIDIARHGHEGHPRQRTANHAIGNHKPWRLPIASKIGFVVRLTRGYSRNDEQQDYIEYEEGEDKDLQNSDNVVMR